MVNKSESGVMDLAIIGSGYGGLAATVFAAQAGLSTALIGGTGGLDFSSGCMDLFSVHPIATGKRHENPWQGIGAMLGDIPNHPLGLVLEEDIRESIDTFTEFLGELGLEYLGHQDKNLIIPTAAGTVKHTYRAPAPVHAGAIAMENKAPALIVDFHGLKGFSARQVAQGLKEAWPGLRHQRLDFPDAKAELYPEHMAWTLSDPRRREELAQAVAPFAKDVEFVGFPAVLGLNDPALVRGHLAELLEREIFEIPTLNPSIAGNRVRTAFERAVPGLGIEVHNQKMVTRAEAGDDVFTLHVGEGLDKVLVKSRTVILATGRFFGTGLRADRDMVREELFDLPVAQPGSRDNWRRPDFFDPRGHPVSEAGIETDANFRPVDERGEVVHDNLHAIGTILAHQNWARQKCGASLAISSAWKAVKTIRSTI